MSQTASATKRFSSAISADKDWMKAVRSVSSRAAQDMGGGCDLAVIFATELYPGLKPGALPRIVAESLPFKSLIGCSTSGVIAGDRELEMEPGVSLLAMRLPGVKLAPFAVSPADLQGMERSTDLLKELDLYPVDKPKFLALADPMSCDIDKWMKLFNEAYPGSPVIGGLASGPVVGRPNWLICGEEAFDRGSVGVALTGDVEFDVVVAQGCRPIGDPTIITKAEGHVLYELGGKPPLEYVRTVVQGLTADDQELARHSLFAGIVMNEYRSKFGKGDFLIRNLMGYDAKSGALMIGANLKVGQTLQFQLRDARTSAEDLKGLLEGVPRRDAAAQGALLVSCCGRGKGLYGKPDHDSRLVQAIRGPVPLAGFFANGELGPVGGKNFIHGYTSSIAFIR